MTEGKIDALASKIPSNKYDEFCYTLGVPYNVSQQILQKEGGDLKLALRSVLKQWNNTINQLNEMRTIMQNIELDDIFEDHLEEILQVGFKVDHGRSKICSVW